MRLRFSIRDLLWLTALVAVLLGWWVDRNRLDQERFQARNAALRWFNEIHDRQLKITDAELDEFIRREPPSR